MPSFTGTIALSTGGLGKSIVGQFSTSTGAQLNVASVGVPPPVALSTYGNGWSSVPASPDPQITAPNTLQVLNAYTTNSNTSVANGILSASFTLDASNTSAQFYFRTTANQTSVGLIKFSYATSNSNVLTVTYIENHNYSAAVIGTATGPAVAPGTAFTGSVTFNGTATTVTINGTASGSFTAVNVTGSTTGVCGVGSNANTVGSVQVGSFALTTTAGAAVFSDNFVYTLSVQPVTISINGGAAINLPSPTWAVPQPGFTIPAPYVFWPLPQYDTHTLWYNSGLYQNDSRPNTVGLGGGTGGYSGSYGIAYAPSASQIAASTLQNEALFPFQGLLPAAWTINATWPALASNSTAVTVTVLSGSSGAGGVSDGTGATLATYTINQTVAPTGGPTINGVVFQTLGSVNVSGAVNGLTVVMANSGTTGQVVFDAVSIAPTSAVSTIIKNTDVVTLSCPTSGWASFADGSYAPVLTSAAVTNKVGGYNFPVVNPASPQTMAIGVNVDGDYDYTIVPFQANFAKRSGVNNSGTVLTASDPVTLYPTILTGVGVAPPSGITLNATSGTGSLAAGTYEYQVASNNAHGTSPASPTPVSITTTSTGEVTIAWTAVSGATSYNVYGRSAGSIAQIVSGVTGTSFTDNGSVVPGGALPTAPSVQISPVIQITQGHADGKILPIAPLGNYTLMWNGTCNLTISSGDRSTSEITADAVITGTTNNTRVYNVADVGQISPGFNINVFGTTGRSDGNWNCDLADLRLYPPGVSTTNPPYVSPWWAATVYGSCIRVMQPIGTNSSSIVNFSDMTPESCMTAYGNYTFSAPVVSVGPGDATRYFFPAGAYPFLVTTATPHGFTAGQIVTLNGPVGTLTYQDGTTINLSGYPSVVDVVDSTHYQAITFGDNSSPVTNTLTPTGCTASVSLLTPGMTLVGAVEAANAASADLWYNIHLLASDAAVTTIAQYIAANLAPGKKWYIEYSNETWNGAFEQNNTCVYLGNKAQSLRGQDYSYYYVKQMGHVQALAMTAWTAAGRTAASLVRVVGSQYSNPGVTTSIAQHMQALGIPGDVLAVAPYLTNQVISTPSLQPIFDVLSVDQLSELLDVTLLWSPRFTQQHLSTLASYGFTNIKAVAYEGSIQEGVPNNVNGNVPTANAYTRDYAVFHHPRMFQQTLFNLAQDQASGITLYNMFINAGPSYPGGMWAALQSYLPNPGTGSMTADAANLTSPLSFSGTAVKNEVWGAYKHWSTVAPNTAGVIPQGLLKFFFHEGTLHGGFLTLGI